MKTSDFDFHLPPELIAQTPSERRDGSRLLVAKRGGGVFEHRRFADLIRYLNEGDCLVLNDSRVIPARLMGRRDTGGSVEVLLLRETRRTTGGAVWECLTRPGRKMRPGQSVLFGDGSLSGTVMGELDDGVRLIELEYGGSLYEALDSFGVMPLPPYIHKKLSDRERYQTVYADRLGSAAAPTAGLHFTPELLDAIRHKGIEVCFVTLHVGLGTFRPVKTEDVGQHRMHTEYYDIPAETADIVRKTKAGGRRVAAVGTTTCRTLESASDGVGGVLPGPGSTDIFMTPGYRFKVIDALLTNFHLPKSTLLMLVSAFMGRENALDAYAEAVKERYRFFSFGDAMLILPGDADR